MTTTNPLDCLQTIQYYLSTNNLPTAINILKHNVPVVAPYLSKENLNVLKKTSEFLTLSKVYFVLQQYDEALSYYIKSPIKNEVNCLYDEFFNRHILIRLLENYNKYSEIINNMFMDDPLLITFCSHDTEMLGILVHSINLPLSVFYNIIDLKCLYGIIKQRHYTSFEDLKIQIDLCIEFGDDQCITRIIENLILLDLNLCYSVCDYVSENIDFNENIIQSIGRYTQLNFKNNAKSPIHNSIELGTHNSLEVNRDETSADSGEIINYEPDSKILENIKYILSGELRRKTFLYLLAKNNKTDFSFLSSLIKPASRSTSMFTSIVYANAIMNLGSSNDTFHRINTDLINQSKHWNKFTGMLCTGMIHFGNEKALDILKNILPNEDLEEGGSLMALGFMKREELNIDFLMNFLEGEVPDTVLYGCIFAIGLLYKNNLKKNIYQENDQANKNNYNGEENAETKKVIEKLMEILNKNHLIGSEASGYAIGMILMGYGIRDFDMRKRAIDIVRSIVKDVANSPTSTPSLRRKIDENKYLEEDRYNEKGEKYSSVELSTEKDNKETDEFLTAVKLDPNFNPNKPSFDHYIELTINTLFTIAKDTEHELISRSCGISLALINIMTRRIDNYTRKLLIDRNETLRYCGCFSIAASFVGTSDLNAISLLSSLINDGSEEVKRGCVLGLGFVCSNDSDTLFNVLEPLGANHSPGVRGAVALSLGFFMSGSSDKRCVDLLEVLLYDSDLLVKQSACIGMGFLLCQSSDRNIKNFKRIVERINFLVLEKQENNACAWGAVIGRSLIESGGRNIIYSIKNRYGKIEKNRVCGAILFMQYWYNYNMFSFVSLCMLPTFYVSINKETMEINNETEIKVNIKEEKYEASNIKLPEVKIRRRRRFRRRYKTIVEDEEVKEEKKEIDYEGESVIKSGERLSLYELGFCDEKDWGFKFI